MVTATGGCAQPVRLRGRRLTIDTSTGEVLDEYNTENEPTGYLLIACGNRRTARCPACADLYRKDAYHLVFAGLAGGKGVPDTISEHPRIFVTLTAPSFGSVHTIRAREGKQLPCRPRREGSICQHGRPASCMARHDPGDPQFGTPLCADCYDYQGAVLWNAHAGQLWKRFRIYTELREWSHMLGYRHFLTKSRRYSTTLSALRQARADHRAAELRQRNGQPDLDKLRVIYESEWRFAGSGHREGEALWAEATRSRYVSHAQSERKSPAHNRQD